MKNWQEVKYFHSSFLNFKEAPLSIEVLDLLLRENDLCAYDIKKRLKAPHSTLHGLIKKLLRAKLIRIVKTEEFRTTLEKKIYDITPLGVGKVLKYVKKTKIEEFMKYINKKRYLHPFLERMKEWKMNETPELSMRVFKDRGMHIFPQYEFPDSPYNPTLDEMVDRFVRMLIAIMFWNDFKQATPGFVWAFTYTDGSYGLAPSDKLKGELAFFMKSNPWVKDKMRRELENEINELQNEIVFMKKILQDHETATK